MTIRLRGLAFLLAGALAMVPLASRAQTKVVVTCTATTDCASAFAAVDQGFFKAHGLDVSVVPIALNSNIPAAMMSGSVQIGGTTLPVFLQAVDGGLDLVAVAGASVTAASTADAVAVVARTGDKIAAPADFAGKKVGVPGIGAFLDVLFRQWLVQHGVDPTQLTFVEGTFPTMTDVLRSGSVDAVVSGEPFLSRTVGTGAGYVVASFLHEMPDNEAIILYAATRAWATAHPDAAHAFHAAIAEGAAFVNANPDRAREEVAQYTKLPITVLRNIPISRSSADVTTAQLDWWTGVMQHQDMLQDAPDTRKLLLP